MGAGTNAHQLIRRGLLRDANHNVRKCDFSAGSRFLIRVRQIVVDLTLGNDDAVFDFPVAQARKRDFLAYFLAELDPGHTVFFECSAELGQRKLVAFSDAAHGAIQFDIGNA